MKLHRPELYSGSDEMLNKVQHDTMPQPFSLLKDNNFHQ